MASSTCGVACQFRFGRCARMGWMDTFTGVVHWSKPSARTASAPAASATTTSARFASARRSAPDPRYALGACRDAGRGPWRPGRPRPAAGGVSMRTTSQPDCANSRPQNPAAHPPISTTPIHDADDDTPRRQGRWLVDSPRRSFAACSRAPPAGFPLSSRAASESRRSPGPAGRQKSMVWRSRQAAPTACRPMGSPSPSSPAGNTVLGSPGPVDDAGPEPAARSTAAAGR